MGGRDEGTAYLDMCILLNWFYLMFLSFMEGMVYVDLQGGYGVC